MLITFEGIDGCGKTTQINLLAQALQAWGFDPILTKQPGGTEIGAKIRALLLDPSHKALCPQSELLLYMADRFQHLAEVIHPALKSGKLVLCDRYHDATLAYQGGGRGLNLEWLRPLEAQLATPALTFLFQISPEAARARINRRNEEQGVESCRLEGEEKSFFDRVAQAYQDLSARCPERFWVIDAQRPTEVIHAEVLQQVLKKIES